MIVAGADGCPAGWVLVLWQGPEGPPPQARLVKKLAEVLTWDERPAFLAVDMPIGLPEKAERGGRRCEREARARLGQRQSSVFSTPARAALAAEAFQEACRLNRAHSDPPRGISKQCFNIFPKIRELAALVTPETQSWLRECHPELAFWAMNGEIPLHLPKKVKSAPAEPGLTLRRTLLEKAGFPLSQLRMPAFKRKDVGKDDVIDACACAWSAWRMSQGAEIRLPAEPLFNEEGLRMEISA